MKKIIGLLIVLFTLFSCKEAEDVKQDISTVNKESKTYLLKTNDKWKLMLNDQEYYIKGVTFGMKVNSTNIDDYMKELSELGCNTIRTWGIGSETQILLDTAYKYNIKVILGIWLRHGQSGDNFDWINDVEGKKTQFDETLNNIKKYKNHPSLLMWCIGNEVILNLGTESEKIAYSQFLENLCSEVKKIDKNHLLSSASASVYDANYWAKLVPSLDLYGINAYGNDIGVISDSIKNLGIDKPYILTEFGAEGEWAVEKDKNGLPVEPPDEDKFSIIDKSWDDWILSKNNCLGGFVFNYGNSWDHGGVWLNMYMKNYKRPAYWAVKNIYCGDNSIRNPLLINKFEFTDNSIYKNQWVLVNYNVTNLNELINKEIYYNKRDGNNSEIIKLETKIENGNLYFKTPSVGGILKIYLFVYDKDNNLAIAQKSLNVNN